MVFPFTHGFHRSLHKKPLIPGGYSLAGLFALWSVFRSDRFKAAAAASPSVWFRGWLDYAASHQPHADYVYLVHAQQIGNEHKLRERKGCLI